MFSLTFGDIFCGPDQSGSHSKYGNHARKNLNVRDRFFQFILGSEYSFPLQIQQIVNQAS